MCSSPKVEIETSSVEGRYGAENCQSAFTKITFFGQGYTQTKSGRNWSHIMATCLDKNGSDELGSRLPISPQLTLASIFVSAIFVLSETTSVEANPS